VIDPKDLRPAQWPTLNAREMLRRLTAAKVDFVVIGGIAMVLQGSARNTRDLDIVFGPSKVNLHRLGEVLAGLDAKLRNIDTPLPFVPDRRTLQNVQLLTLDTSQGWLDVHRSVDGMGTYSALRKNADRMVVGDFSVLVANRDDLIGMKRAAGRDIDRTDLKELAVMKSRDRTQ
jgi:predicted nucleotidyltransferase